MLLDELLLLDDDELELVTLCCVLLDELDDELLLEDSSSAGAAAPPSQKARWDRYPGATAMPALQTITATDVHRCACVTVPENTPAWTPSKPAIVHASPVFGSVLATRLRTVA